MKATITANVPDVDNIYRVVETADRLSTLQLKVQQLIIEHLADGELPKDWTSITVVITRQAGRAGD